MLESVHVLLEPQWLARVAAEALDLNPDRVTLPPIYGLSDTNIRAAMLALDAELSASGPGGHLLAESLGNVLAVHLLRRFSASEPTGVHSGGVLPRHKLRAVIEYIQEASRPVARLLKHYFRQPARSRSEHLKAGLDSDARNLASNAVSLRTRARHEFHYRPVTATRQLPRSR
jgi:hypothetical protein